MEKQEKQGKSEKPETPGKPEAPGKPENAETPDRRKDFYYQVIEDVWIRKLYSEKEALVKINENGSFLAPERKEIKTVGLYYVRLSNGGVERVISKLSYILSDKGFHVVVLTQYPAAETDFDLAPGTKRIVLGADFADPLERAQAWGTAIRQYHIDLVVYNAWTDPHMNPDAMAIKAEGIPVILYAHGSADFIYRFRIGYCMPQDIMFSLFDAAAVLSDVAEAWWRSLGLNAFKVHNPAAYDVKEEPPSLLQTKDVLWAGRISPEKQYEDAFAIADLVHRRVPEFRLRVVGKTEDETEFEEIKKRIETSGRSSFIILEGFHTDVAPFYRSSSAFLSTSYTEGYPMTLLESKVFGLPLVAYDIPGVDFMRYPKGTFLVEQRDCSGAAEKLIRLLTDDALRRQMGCEAREDAEKISEIDIGEEWKALFEAVCERKSRKASLNERPAIDTAVVTILHELTDMLEERTRLVPVSVRPENIPLPEPCSPSGEQRAADTQKSFGTQKSSDKQKSFDKQKASDKQMAADVAEGFLDITQMKALEGKAFVTEAYRRILKRKPDEEGLAVHLEHLKNGMTKGELLMSLNSSPEGMKKSGIPEQELARMLLAAGMNPFGRGLSGWKASLRFRMHK